ncbi:MAG: fumarylacetoacetate hydrolase family protein [Candidatus Micrarchaeia archaeon]
MKIGTVMLDGKRRAAIFEGSVVKLLDREDARKHIENPGNLCEEVNAGDVEFLPPIPNPEKIVCVGLNYREHARELIEKKLLNEIPNEPTIFLKPPSALIGHEGRIMWPRYQEVKRVDYEAELAVVIGKKCRNVSPEEAGEFIAGLTCFNDVTARDVQKRDGQWTRAKSYDTFAPLGPWIVKGVDADNLRIRCILNGKVVQDSRTSDMIFGVNRVVSFISCVMTLKCGDIIATGTPSGVGELHKGDVVEVEIENIGILRNRVF